MPIYDNNGSVNSLIGKVYDHNGSVQSAISKVYDNNGSVNNLLYQDTVLLFENGDQCTAITGGWKRIPQDYGPSDAYLGNTMEFRYYYSSRYSQGGDIHTINLNNNTGLNKIAVTYSVNLSNNPQQPFAALVGDNFNWKYFNLADKIANQIYTQEFDVPQGAFRFQLSITAGGNDTTMIVYKVEFT